MSENLSLTREGIKNIFKRAKAFRRELYGDVICDTFSEEELSTMECVIGGLLTAKEKNNKSLRYPVRLLAIMILIQIQDKENLESKDKDIMKTFSYDELKKYLGFYSMRYETLEKIVNILKDLIYREARVFVFDEIFLIGQNSYNFIPDVKTRVKDRKTRVIFRFNDKVVNRIRINRDVYSKEYKIHKIVNQISKPITYTKVSQ